MARTWALLFLPVTSLFNLPRFRCGDCGCASQGSTSFTFEQVKVYIPAFLLAPSKQPLTIYFIPSPCFSIWSSLSFKLEYSPIISFQQMEVSNGRLRGIRAGCFHLHVAYFHTFIPNLPMLAVAIIARVPGALCLGRWGHIPYKKKRVIPSEWEGGEFNFLKFF